MPLHKKNAGHITPNIRTRWRAHKPLQCNKMHGTYATTSQQNSMHICHNTTTRRMAYMSLHHYRMHRIYATVNCAVPENCQEKQVGA